MGAKFHSRSKSGGKVHEGDFGSRFWEAIRVYVRLFAVERGRIPYLH